MNISQGFIFYESPFRLVFVPKKKFVKKRIIFPNKEEKVAHKQQNLENNAIFLQINTLLLGITAKLLR